MELNLRAFPEIKDKVGFIYQKMAADDFEYLQRTQMASPSSADEYRNALIDLLDGRKLTSIPDEALAEGFVFEINPQNEEYSIELPLYVDGEPSDIFGIFRSKATDKGTTRYSVFLYDILVP